MNDTEIIIQLREDLRQARESAAYWEKAHEQERAERQKTIGMQEYRGNTVRYMYDKAKCYGDMVHGCATALAAAGFPVDENASDGQVGAIARAVKAMADKIAELSARPSPPTRDGAGEKGGAA